MKSRDSVMRRIAACLLMASLCFSLGVALVIVAFSSTGNPATATISVGYVTPGK